MLHELSDWQKVIPCRPGTSPVTRLLGGTLIDAAASLDWGPAEKRPLLKNASLKAAMCGSVVDGFYSSIKPKDLAKLTSKDNRKLAGEGEKLMEDCRAVLNKYNQTPSTAAASLGKCDSRVFLHICGRSKDIEGRQFKDLSEIAEDFLSCLYKLAHVSVDLKYCVCDMHVYIHMCEHAMGWAGACAAARAPA